MDYNTYRQKYYTHPAPEPRFEFGGLHGITLYFSDYEDAVAYYSQVLGPPAYVEADHTRGWRVGATWLTLLKGRSGSPQNVEVQFVMPTSHEAERLQAAFIEAGGTGEAPSEQLMYTPVHYCPVIDPFGTNLLIISSLEGAA